MVKSWISDGELYPQILRAVDVFRRFNVIFQARFAKTLVATEIMLENVDWIFRELSQNEETWATIICIFNQSKFKFWLSGRVIGGGRSVLSPLSVSGRLWNWWKSCDLLFILNVREFYKGSKNRTLPFSVVGEQVLSLTPYSWSKRWGNLLHGTNIFVEKMWKFLCRVAFHQATWKGL